MGVADGAAVKHEDAGGLRQAVVQDQGGGIRRVERDRDVELAVVEQLELGRPGGREHLAAAPQVRVQRLEIGPQRRGRLGEGGAARRRLLQDRRVRREFDEDLLQERRADEVGRRGVGEAARVRLGPVEEGGDAARRLVDPGAVVDEVDLGHAPGRLEALGRHGEVDPRGRLAREVDQPVVGQALGEGPEQQAVLLHGGEVLAVDPDEVDRAALVSPGRLLGQHAGDRLGRVGELHVAQRDAVVGGDPLADPGDVGVDPLVAAPGVPEHGLAARLGDDVVPVLRPGAAADAKGEQGAEGKRDKVVQAAHGCAISPSCHRVMWYPAHYSVVAALSAAGAGRSRRHEACARRPRARSGSPGLDG